MILLQQALRRGMPAQPIDSKLTAVGKDERAMSVSGYVHRAASNIRRWRFTKPPPTKVIRGTICSTKSRAFASALERDLVRLKHTRRF
jgi:hypothetical protein